MDRAHPSFLFYPLAPPMFGVPRLRGPVLRLWPQSFRTLKTHNYSHLLATAHIYSQVHPFPSPSLDCPPWRPWFGVPSRVRDAPLCPYSRLLYNSASSDLLPPASRLRRP